MSLRDNRIFFICLIAATLAVFSVARADSMNTASVPAEDAMPSVSTPSNGTTAADSKSGMSEFMSHMNVTYFGIFHGPSVSNIDSNTVDTKTGKESKTTMYMDSEVTLPYTINESVSVAPVIPFLLNVARGEAATLGDLGFKITDRKTISTSNFNLYTNLIIQAPTSDYSKNRGMNAGLKTTPNFRYIFQGTRFSVGSWSEAKAYLGVTSGKTFKLYAAPYANYQITHKFSLNLEYEMEADHMVNTTATKFGMVQNDVMPGFIYMITPTVMLNPYLQVFTAQNVDSDHMALGAVLSASL